MKKNTMYILGGVAVVGLAYYLYNRNKQASNTNNAPAFANVTGTTLTTLDPSKTASPCGACGSNEKYVTAWVYSDELGGGRWELICVACGQRPFNNVQNK